MDSRFSVLARWKLTSLAEPHAVAGGFSGALVFRIQCLNGLFALRGWPRGSDPGRLLSLHRLLVHVAAQNVPVAVPLCSDSGSRLVSHDTRLWQVEPWLPGHAAAAISPGPAKLASAMSSLAAFHNAAASFAPAPDDAEWFGGAKSGAAPTIIERRRFAADRLLSDEPHRIRQRIGPRDSSPFADVARTLLFHAEALGERIYDELSRSMRLHVPLQPVLRDIWRDHVLFTGDHVTGIVDPAACRRDSVAADLSRLLGSLCGNEERQWQFALDCYEKCRNLDDYERMLVPVLDRSGVVLSAMNWLRRHYVAGQECDQPAVIARLRELAGRMERMSR